MAQMPIWIRFGADQKGAVAVIFSLSLLALLTVAGLALDHARSVSTQSALQADLDATLLHVGKKKQSAPDGQFNAQEVAKSYLRNLRRTKHADEGRLSLTVSEVAPGRFKAKASLAVPTTFSKLVGVSKFSVSVSSEIASGDQPIEVALVLDNTFSMSGSRLDSLKTAAKSLIDTAFAVERAEQNVKVSLVPFAQYVNVGLANRNQSWMSVPADSTTTEPQVCYQNTPVIGQSNCRTETGTATNDGVPYTYTYQTCDYQYGPPEQVCYTPTTTLMWSGCAGSRDYPLETLDDNYDTEVPGVMNAACPSEITPLTNDAAALAGKVDAMVATGDTYIPSGLIWGWRTLSKEAPFEEAEGYGALVQGQPVRKFMVLMSDGKNTLSPVYPAHTGNDPALSDQLSLEICNNIKAKGIEIYTVAFEIPDATAKDVLESCASSPSKFFDAQDGAELNESFRKIAQDFNPLRLTQ
jgi:Mg-chelatase subunit ChlD